MWPIAIVSAALLLYACLDDIIALVKSNDPHYQKAKEKQRLEQEVEKQELIQRLNEWIGEDCQIESKHFYLMSQSNKLTAKIIQTDQEWVELLLIKNGKIDHLVVKVQDIISVSKILS